MSSILYRTTTLVLTKTWMPCGVKTAKEAIVMMFSGHYDGDKHHPPALALNFEYPILDDGSYDLHNPTSYEPVGWDRWIKLPVRDCDDHIATAKMKIRVPTVLVAANFSPKKPLVHKHSPTKRRIYERDGGLCQYSQRKVSFHEATLDHILPKSRGGKNTFTNLVLAAPEVNRLKADKTPEEAGLRLAKKPTAPPDVPIYATIVNNIGSPDWEHFVFKKEKK